ncbi:MAG: hypothetical protein HYZ28_17010 [Myxococcales bacterium]|nr:hypothetical protein [Myxococcales bacterium]
MTRAHLWRLAVALALLLSCGPTRTPLLGTGEPCTPAPPGESSTECADGVCVALDAASGFCTLSCTDDSGCPTDFLCQAAGRYGKVCRKLTGCKLDTDCPAGHACNPDTRNCYIKVSRTLCSPCQDVLQCPQGGACFTALGSGEQFCTGPCGASGGCPLGFECKDIPAGKDRALIKQCVPRSMSCNLGKPICTSCEGDSECGGPMDLCVRNVVSQETFCGRDCDPQNASCPEGFSCVDIGGPFQCVPNSNTCKAYCDSADELGQIRQCGLGQECDLVSKSCRAATDGRMCSPCLDNDDCRRGTHPENRCIVNNCASCSFRGEAFCSTPCADDAACAATFGPGFACIAVAEPSGGTRSFCVPQRGTCRSGLGRLGDDCSAGGAQDCVAGICLVAGTTSLCSVPCKQDVDCGDTRYLCCEYTANGYDCSAEKRSTSGPKSGTGVCAPLGGLFGDDCSPGRPPCQTGTCLDLGTARVCTLPCGSGLSCPAGFTCRKAELLGSADAGTQQREVCFPEGGGKAGADCSFGPAACESGLCIRKDSGPVCSAHCADVTECPEGWSCTQVLAIDGQPVQACLPPSVQ